MSWQKLGLVFLTAANRPWSQTHSAVPVVDSTDPSRWRIYYGTRDRQNRTLTSFVDVEPGNPTKIIYEHPEPILPLGLRGTFDDCGVMPSWVVDHDGRKYLYYIGWTVRKTIPYHNSIGLALSDDGGTTFKRYALGPLFSPLPHEPYFTGTSCVLKDKGVWKNWYLSCTKWELIDDHPEPFYNLKYAESDDGIHWRRDGIVAIDYKSDLEAGLVKASVLRSPDGYRMWYSYRECRGYREDKNHSYRIGYAESSDGIRWTRKDSEVGIDVSPDGWDSVMQCYPHVIEHGRDLYLFYNGNGFGRTGFGCAKWIG